MYIPDDNVYLTTNPSVGAGMSVVTRREVWTPLFHGIEKVSPVIEAVIGAAGGGGGGGGGAAGGGAVGGGAAGGGATTGVAIKVRLVFADAVPVLPVRVAVD